MRKVLLAGVALAGVAAFMTEARAQTAPPPTVFPETTTPGKLDGAAPNSVTINIGFQQLTAIMGEWGTGATGDNSRAEPQLFNWFHFFPSMDYANPAGIHWGISAEIRNNNSGQTSLNGGNTFYVHDAHAYVSSDRFGKFAVGTPNGALDDLGVGTGDDFGDGDFYSWYGPPNAPAFAMADSYDGDTPRQKLLYELPTFAGLKAGISYEPTDVALDHSTSLTTGDVCTGGIVAGSCAAFAHPTGLARNRVEVAAQFNRTFGQFGLKADVGGAFSGSEGDPAGRRTRTSATSMAARWSPSPASNSRAASAPAGSTPPAPTPRASASARPAARPSPARRAAPSTLPASATTWGRTGSVSFTTA